MYPPIEQLKRPALFGISSHLLKRLTKPIKTIADFTSAYGLIPDMAKKEFDLYVFKVLEEMAQNSLGDLKAEMKRCQSMSVQELADDSPDLSFSLLQEYLSVQEDLIILYSTK